MTVGASAGHDVLRGIGVDGDGAARAEQPSQAQGLPGPPPRLSAEDLQRLLKKQKKAAHKARKEVKKVQLHTMLSSIFSRDCAPCSWPIKLCSVFRDPLHI